MFRTLRFDYVKDAAKLNDGKTDENSRVVVGEGFANWPDE